MAYGKGKKPSKSGKSVYEIAAERVIKMLEEALAAELADPNDKVVWRKPWLSKGVARAYDTQTPYRGINAIVLPPGEYATFRRISELGGKVNAHEKGLPLFKWNFKEVKEEGSDEVKIIPSFRYFTVFEINSQCTGIPSKQKAEIEIDNDPIEAAERIVQEYTNKPPIKFAPGRAFYSPSLDYISVPPINDYPEVAEYYSTMFHEMAHSTGHKSRLNREGVEDCAAKFGSQTYSKEELVAELTAAMLCAEVGIEQTTMENSVAYLRSWISKLKDDPKMVVQASSKAQKAVDFIRNIKSKENDPDVDVTEETKEEGQVASAA